MQKAVFYGTEVDYCPKCLGLWFEQDELRQAKDEKDANFNWLDVDLWKDKARFKVSEKDMLCPVCSVPMYSVKYGDSDIEVDVCNVCKGIWLDRGEFKKISDYLKEKGKSEIMENYFKNFFKQGIEVFSGPETLREEVDDFLTVLKFLDYKFTAKHLIISKIILDLPK